MQELFVGTFGFFFLIGAIVLILIASLLLWLFAKTIGKIENAGFGNSFLITLASSITHSLLWYFLAKINISSMLIALLVIVITYAIVYVIIGKLIWKCSWEKSIKANAILTTLFAIVMFYTMRHEL